MDLKSICGGSLRRKCAKNTPRLKDERPDESFLPLWDQIKVTAFQHSLIISNHKFDGIHLESVRFYLGFIEHNLATQHLSESLVDRAAAADAVALRSVLAGAVRREKDLNKGGKKLQWGGKCVDGSGENDFE